MSKTIELSKHQGDTLRDVFGDDAWLIKCVAEWRIARAEQQKIWAERDLENGWGHLADGHLPDIDLAPLEMMKSHEEILAECKPRTVLLARELLRVCSTILAHTKEESDPDACLSHGPILEIIRNVVDSLGGLDGTTRIGSDARSSRVECISPAA